MKIKVYAPGFINHELIDNNGFVELADGKTVAHLYRKMKVTPLARLVVASFVNYEPAKMKTVLQDGDTVSLMFPVTGG
jgi:molybdopterin converting factor small subunit